MQKLFLLSLLLLVGCAPQKKWQYSSFSEKPEYPLSQAKAICSGYADSFSQNAGNYKAKKYLDCNTSGNAWNGAWNSNTRCQTTSNEWDELSAAAKNVKAKRDSFNTIYKSCLAQHGWSARLEEIDTKPRERKPSKLYKCQRPDGTIMETTVNKLTCTMAYKGKVIE